MIDAAGNERRGRRWMQVRGDVGLIEAGCGGGGEKWSDMKMVLR